MSLLTSASMSKPEIRPVLELMLPIGASPTSAARRAA
jgi:hypothetical protein